MVDKRTQATLALAAIGIGAILYLFLGSPGARLAPEPDAGPTNTPKKHDMRDAAQRTAVEDDRDAPATTPVEIFSGNFELAKIQRKSGGDFKKNFVFPDGEQISITFKRDLVEHDSIGDLDDGVTGGFFERLSKPASEGNGTAAKHLYRSLKACTNRPKTEQELQERIRKLETAGIAATDGQPVEEHIANWQKAYERCKGVDHPAMLQQSLKYLRKAADLGHEPSAVRFATDIVDHDPDLAAKYFERLWKAGHAHGAFGLSRAYRNQETMTYEDSVKAYAYHYAAYAAGLALFDGIPGEVVARSRQRMISEMEAATLAASPNVVEEATLLAKDLIASNASCCKY